MRAAAIIVLPFVLVYLAAVMVSLDWSPSLWASWLQWAVGISYGCMVAFWAVVWLVYRDFKTGE